MRTVLYVEDDVANLMLVEDIVARLPDIRLLSARDGSHGLALARSALPEVILMDINLPDINGFEAMKILKKDVATTHIPVIALSSVPFPDNIKQGLAEGFFRYLAKPFKVSCFLEALNIALQMTEQNDLPGNLDVS